MSLNKLEKYSQVYNILPSKPKRSNHYPASFLVVVGSRNPLVPYFVLTKEKTLVCSFGGPLLAYP